MTNPTLSERLRDMLTRATVRPWRISDPDINRQWITDGDGGDLLHAEEFGNFLPSADDCALICELVNATPEILQALDDNEKWAQRRREQNIQLESDNARYRATIVQLEKERAEAVERADKAEKEVRAAEKYRSETGSW